MFADEIPEVQLPGLEILQEATVRLELITDGQSTPVWRLLVVLPDGAGFRTPAFTSYGDTLGDAFVQATACVQLIERELLLQ